ncbi:hypothetical protein Tco_1368526, partial [Tanacetum coccineum]
FWILGASQMAPVVSEMVVASAVVKVEDIPFMFVQGISNYQQQSGYSSHANADYLNFATEDRYDTIPDNLPIAIPRPRRDGSTTSSVCVYEFGSEKHMFMHNSLLSWWKKVEKDGYFVIKDVVEDYVMQMSSTISDGTCFPRRTRKNEPEIGPMSPFSTPVIYKTILKVSRWTGLGLIEWVGKCP